MRRIDIEDEMELLVPMFATVDAEYKFLADQEVKLHDICNPNRETFLMKKEELLAMTVQESTIIEMSHNKVGTNEWKRKVQEATRILEEDMKSSNHQGKSSA